VNLPWDHLGAANINQSNKNQEVDEIKGHNGFETEIEKGMAGI
jgi:hypothetical protein